MTIAIVNGNRGTATEKTSDQTLAVTPLANFTGGNWALLAVVIDNTGTGEGATTDLSVTDTANNVWVRLREQTEANTAALTGVTCAFFLAFISTRLATTDTINIAIAANSTAKGAGLAELSAAAGFNIVLSASGANGSNAAAATTYSVALSGLTNVPGMYVGVSAAEEEVDTAVTLDAGYAEIGFGSIGSGTAGVATSNVRARVGTLSNTSTGDTFDLTGLTVADRATILVRLEEEAIDPNPLLTRRITASDTAQKVQETKSTLAYEDVAVAGLYPLVARLVQAHSPTQKEMQAYTFLPIVEEEPPPVVAVDIPPIPQVVSSGISW